MSEPKLVVPSEIPWDTLRGRDLEECIYWLLDDMGAKDLVWRQGGEGQGGTDQGRDIEATFYADGPDGEMHEQRWWVEAKGRGRTLEPAAVRNALDNSLCRGDVDVVVVATNANFSNPTREWVTEWQRNHPRPKARLWDRAGLERMVTKHPSVALRMFPKALSPQGRLEAVTARFWGSVQMPSRGDLEGLWCHNPTLKHSHESLLALTAGEFCNGDISRRPWLVFLAPYDLTELLILAMSNLLGLSLKAQDRGANAEAVGEAVQHVFMMSLLRVPNPMLISVVRQVGKYVKPAGLLDEVQSELGQLVVGHTYRECLRLCLSDCRRIFGGIPKAEPSEASIYWQRFCEPKDAVDEEPEELPEDVFTCELYDAPCAAGFSLDKDHTCPLLALDAGDLLTEDCIQVLSATIARRVRRTLSDDDVVATL